MAKISNLREKISARIRKEGQKPSRSIKVYDVDGETVLATFTATVPLPSDKTGRDKILATIPAIKCKEPAVEYTDDAGIKAESDAALNVVAGTVVLDALKDRYAAAQETASAAPSRNGNTVPAVK